MENNDFGSAMEFWARTVGTAIEATVGSIRENATQVAERLNGPEFKGRIMSLLKDKVHSFSQYLSHGTGAIPTLARKFGFVSPDQHSVVSEVRQMRMSPEEVQKRRDRLAELRKSRLEGGAASAQPQKSNAPAAAEAHNAPAEAKDSKMESVSKRVADNGDWLKSEIDAIKKNPFAVFNIEKSVSQVNGKISEYLSVNGKDLSDIGKSKGSVDPETMKRIFAQIEELSKNLNVAASHPKLPADARKGFSSHAAAVEAIKSNFS